MDKNTLLWKTSQLSTMQEVIIGCMLKGADDNVFVGSKTDIANHLKVSRSTVDQAIKKAISLDLLCEKSKREFMLNPEYFVYTLKREQESAIKEYQQLKQKNECQK